MGRRAPRTRHFFFAKLFSLCLWSQRKKRQTSIACERQKLHPLKKDEGGVARSAIKVFASLFFKKASAVWARSPQKRRFLFAKPFSLWRGSPRGQSSPLVKLQSHTIPRGWRLQRKKRQANIAIKNCLRDGIAEEGLKQRAGRDPCPFAVLFDCGLRLVFNQCHVADEACGRNLDKGGEQIPAAVGKVARYDHLKVVFAFCEGIGHG